MGLPKQRLVDTSAEIAMKQKAYQDWIHGDPNREDTNYKRAKKALPKVMSKLTPTQQYYLGLYFGEDLTMQEIADRVGRHKSTVCRTIQRALKTMYDYMSIVSPEYVTDMEGGYQRMHNYHRRKEHRKKRCQDE